jgi:hypothetical protein
MNLWYGYFIGNFKSPTCPDVPGGKEIFFASTIRLYQHSVAVDQIYRDLTVFCFPSLWRPLCAWEKKNCFTTKVQVCSKEHADEIFFLKFHPTLGRNSWKLAEGQNHCRRHCGPAASFKISSFDCRAKIFIFTHSIRFLRGCSAPIGCNLNWRDFHEIPALGLI